MLRQETGLSKLLTPEEIELQQKKIELAQLENQLADAELELATSRAELRAFEQHYLEIVGRRYAELDEWEAKIAAALAAQEPKNEDLQKRAERARETAKASAQQSKTESDRAAASDFKPNRFQTRHISPA